jgi:hypothetical protein
MTLRKPVMASLRVAPSCGEGGGPMTLRKSPQAGPMILRTGKGFEPSTSTLAKGKRAFLAVTACDKYRESHPWA